MNEPNQEMTNQLNALKEEGTKLKTLWMEASAVERRGIEALWPVLVARHGIPALDAFMTAYEAARSEFGWEDARFSARVSELRERVGAAQSVIRRGRP
jgi:hypothetical protein